MIRLKPDEIFKVITDIEYGQYTSMSGLHSLKHTMDRIGITNFNPESSRFKSNEIQLLNNTLNTLINKIEELENAK